MKLCIQKLARFGKYAYLPLTAVLTAYPHDFRVKGGCSCAGTIPSGGVVITYGSKGVIKIIPGNEKNARLTTAGLFDVA